MSFAAKSDAKPKRLVMRDGPDGRTLSKYMVFFIFFYLLPSIFSFPYNYVHDITQPDSKYGQLLNMTRTNIKYE